MTEINTVDSSLLASLGGEVQASATEASTGNTPTPSNHYSSGLTSGLEDKALSLLGSGISAEQTAAALGVTPSRISQLLSESAFAARVAEIRYKSLQAHNLRDNKYDSIEDKLLKKLESQLPLIMRPADIINALTKVNAAKRRGQSAPNQVTNQQTVVNLILPSAVVNKVSIDMNNQVTKAGEQELLTMPSGNLLKRVEEAAAARELPPATKELQDAQDNS